MAKFYVQSGSFKGIVDCYDDECAAVWAIQRVMERNPGVDDMDSEAANGDDPMVDAIFGLDDFIQLNEQGFDRDDSVLIELHQAFLLWHQLRKAIEELTKSWEEKLGE
jgi:hypothetical protein